MQKWSSKQSRRTNCFFQEEKNKNKKNKNSKNKKLQQGRPSNASLPFPFFPFVSLRFFPATFHPMIQHSSSSSSVDRLVFMKHEAAAAASGAPNQRLGSFFLPFQLSGHLLVFMCRSGAASSQGAPIVSFFFHFFNSFFLFLRFSVFHHSFIHSFFSFICRLSDTICQISHLSP